MDDEMVAGLPMLGGLVLHARRLPHPTVPRTDMEANMRTLKTIIVDLGAPSPDTEKITFGRTVVHLMENNPRFPNPPVSLEVVKGHLDTYASDQQSVRLRAAGAAAQRDVSRAVVMQDLMMLRAYVQLVAQTSPAEASAIAESAGMSLRRMPGHHRPELAVKCTGPGTVALTAKAVAAKASYYWQYSLDGVTWTSAHETLRATTTIAGLPARSLVYFRFRALTDKGQGDFSQVVSQLVA
ncbi:MAG: hypothetical protein QM820_36775 [Minicystis sp.]